MPSLVESLGARLRELGEQLPLPELSHAAVRLRGATELCGYVMTSSGHTDWLAELTTAGTHLDDAIAATRSVLDGLDRYLTTIGLPGVAVPETVAPVAVRARAGAAVPGEEPEPELAVRYWWADRIAVLTGGEPADQRPETVRTAGKRPGHAPPEDPADALRRLVGAARDGRDSYRDALLRTHPATGLALAGPAGRAVRPLATDLLGHAPTPPDARPLADRGTPRCRELLPGLPPALGDDLLGQLCDPFGTGGDGARRHPVDVAACWPVLVGALLRAAGRDTDALPELTAVARVRPDDTVRRDGR